MGRRRSYKEGLTRIFSVRVSDCYYKRLEEIRKNSNCQYNYKMKQYHAGYGYDLEMTVAKYPIREQVDAEQKTRMLKSLEKGNLTQVTFVKEGKDEKMFVTANPQYKTLDLYDSQMQKQFQGIEKREKEGASKSEEKKETQKQEVDDEGEPKKGKKAGRKKGIGV